MATQATGAAAPGPAPSTTGGAPGDGEAQPDPPSLAALKEKCISAWIAHPTKVGSTPYKADVWAYFYPVEEPASYAPGEVPLPYDGKVKSIFLGDEQTPLSRKAGAATVVGYLIGRVDAVANVARMPRIHPRAAGFRADLQDAYDLLTLTLKAARVRGKQQKRQFSQLKQSQQRGAATSSAAAFKQMNDSPSPTSHRSKVRRTKSVGAMDSFVHRQRAEVVVQHSDRIAHDQARLFVGCNISDVTADSPLFSQFVNTLLEAGAAGATLPPFNVDPTDAAAGHVRLLTHQQLGGDVSAPALPPPSQLQHRPSLIAPT